MRTAAHNGGWWGGGIQIQMLLLPARVRACTRVWVLLVGTLLWLLPSVVQSPCCSLGKVTSATVTMGETFNSFMNSIARTAPFENDWGEDNAGEWRFFTGESVWGPSFEGLGQVSRFRA